jgi:hypothetical protein
MDQSDESSVRRDRIMNRLLTLGGLLFMATLATTAGSAQHPAMPSGMTHEEHLAEMQKEAGMKRRGAAAMGFDQDATAHHFVLKPAGGYIQVQANDPSDGASRDAIRTHLRAIADAFASGDFSKPFMTHAGNPPGVEAMTRLKAAIRFTFEEIEAGGRVQIATADATAVKAVHDFLRYQIKEHATGDRLDVQE